MTPIADHFLHGNLVFATRDDVWVGYRLDGVSYPGLSAARKIELAERLEAFAYAVEADFQVFRAAREWSVESYVERTRAATFDRRTGDHERFEAMLAEHRARLADRRVVRPETFLFVRLGAPLRGGASIESLAGLMRDAKRALGLDDAQGVSASRIAELRRAEERTFDRLFDYVPCERARSSEIARLVRAAYARGLGEPQVDPNWRPQALWVDGDKDVGEARFEPFEHDLLRLHDSRIRIDRRSLRIDCEAGVSHQALLVVGALPEETDFPSADAELMFAPLELDFPVDAMFAAEYLPNAQARKLAQKRMVDADQQAKEESYGEHGPTPVSEEKTVAARELQLRVAGSDRPPLLRSALLLAVGAPSEDELERRVERLRSEFGRIELHRPVGEQHRLFTAAMPARGFPIHDYKSHLLPEEFGAMVPNAISHAGSEIGPYVGYALTGSRAPVQFDAAEACAANRPPTVLLTGSLGSGKTMLLQLLEYQALLAGSFICDIDPKGGGDHGLLRLPGVADRAEVIRLGPEERFRGLLDPLRVGEPETRAELAYAFLTQILPPPVPPRWQTEIRAAVEAVAPGESATTGAVVATLRGAGEAGAAAARALEVHLAGGLARLGWGEPAIELPDVGEADVVCVEIRNLTLPQPGTARSEFQEAERVSQAVLALLAAYALRLCARDKRRHAVLGLDEAWALVDSAAGRSLLSRFSRMGRSQNLTPVLASQIVGDTEALEPLVGSYFGFGVETEAEARRTLELCRLDADDEALRQRLLGFRAGRCYFRDVEGRVVPMRIEPGESFISACDTTPERGDSAEHDDQGGEDGQGS